MTRRRQRGGTLKVVVFLLFVLGMVGFGYWAVQKVSASSSGVGSGEVSQLLQDNADLRAQLAIVQEPQSSGWKDAAWIVGIIGGVVVLVVFIKSRSQGVGAKLTIDKALKLGEKMLFDNEGFVTVWKNGDSWDRRENSPIRVLFLKFVRSSKLHGKEANSSVSRYIAVLNDSWEHRVVFPDGLTQKQCFELMKVNETIGFSIEKSAEEAAYEYLEKRTRQAESDKAVFGPLIGGAE